MKRKASFLALKATGVRAPGANILKQEMLSLGGEAAVSRGVINCSVERSDVLILGTEKQVRRLVKKLRPQPFGLRQMADELEEALRARRGRFELPWRGGVLRLSERPHVMGVVNITPDSFSDGGDHLAPEVAAARAVQMVDEGADILDLGAESTRPGADPVSEEEELARLMPVLEHLAPRVPVPISVDTYRSRVARRAVEAGASIINDISGLKADPEMAAVAAETGASVVLMHMRGTPRTMQLDTSYADLLGEVGGSLRECAEKALAAGVAREKIVLDPGIGFGKDKEGNLLLLQRLGELSSLGYPLLVGASRKAFIGRVLGIERPKERLEGALAAAVLAIWNGAQCVRVHDVRETRRAVDLAWAVRQAHET
ncbi:MAG: dihydropteroate synthase [Deltaproteobacteria bacterium]|nr:dihydropteroate synthase [Deltaproteobacteria bacterium]